MDISKIGSNILNAFKVLGLIAGAIGAIYLVMFIITIILGSIFKIAQDGTLPITVGANTTLTTLETSYNTAVGDVNTGTTFATSLIPIAVILLIFGGIVVLGYTAYKNKKNNSNNY